MKAATLKLEAAVVTVPKNILFLYKRLCLFGIRSAYFGTTVIDRASQTQSRHHNRSLRLPAAPLRSSEKRTELTATVGREEVVVFL